MLKTWRKRIKIENRNRFLSTREITLLDSIFDVLIINSNLYWKPGRIDLKSKRLNSFMLNNSSLSCLPYKIWQILSEKVGWAKKLFSVKYNLISSNLSSHITILFLVFCSNEKKCHTNVCLSLWLPPSVSKHYNIL